jgi:hypothetical protein
MNIKGSGASLLGGISAGVKGSGASLQNMLPIRRGTNDLKVEMIESQHKKSADLSISHSDCLIMGGTGDI